jgi:outer membrane protein assembly factor BamE (lipoprotein component of BamABCDE complex)
MTKTTYAARACIAILLAITLTACATTLGRNFDDTYAQQIKPGQTTKAEIRARLGRPPLVRGSKDEETWTYAYYAGRNWAFKIVDMLGFTDTDEDQGRQKRLVVDFKGDVVRAAKFTQELPELDNR